MVLSRCTSRLRCPYCMTRELPSAARGASNRQLGFDLETLPTFDAAPPLRDNAWARLGLSTSKDYPDANSKRPRHTTGAPKTGL